MWLAYRTVRLVQTKQSETNNKSREKWDPIISPIEKTHKRLDHEQFFVFMLFVSLSVCWIRVPRYPLSYRFGVCRGLSLSLTLICSIYLSSFPSFVLSLGPTFNPSPSPSLLSYSFPNFLVALAVLIFFFPYPRYPFLSFIHFRFVTLFA